MIEGTLVLKRFADKSIAGLFEANPETSKSDEDIDMAPSDIPEIPGEVGVPERQRRMDLEDTIRVGFKAGMGSRQNAPAEWIGK